MLPNFLVIGSSRSGTTFMKKILEQHPEIYMGSEGAYTGDIHFFNNSHAVGKWKQGIDWYKKFFDGVKNEKAIGQKSGLYFSDYEAPELIQQTLEKNTKFISTLRNPMERAYSSYWYQFEDIPKGVSFLEAFEMEKNNQLKLPSPLCNPGLYYKHLTNYLNCFDDKQFHFIIFDYMRSNPLEEIKKVYSFLNVDDNFIPNNYDKKVNQAIGKNGMTYQLKQGWGFIKLHFPGSYSFIKKTSIAKRLRAWLGKSSDKAASKKGYPDISMDEWEYLSDIYYESNKKMGEYLGVDLISLWHNLPKHLKNSIS